VKWGVVVFPGSNCDRDALWALREALGQDAGFIWHQAKSVEGFDAIVLPGGFSYGDYLRTGAIARFSPVMESVEEFARRGGLVLGICNGFQILLEAGLLPGAMLRNDSLQFRCRYVHLRVENEKTPFTLACSKGDVLRIPIAHNEGNYYADEATIRRLIENGRVVFRYCDAAGCVTLEANPNGSMENIAGICNERGNVLGMMPHPERCSESLLGSADGAMVFKSLIKFWERGERPSRNAGLR
jgi:phosphoribosylformylglycinamidine synthase